ncbi:MAG TPA: PEGA domain-containing protein, partial [Nannocystis exedens]|nr:PEGA domain-containing protein [Nannocystis exedens]
IILVMVCQSNGDETETPDVQEDSAGEVIPAAPTAGSITLEVKPSDAQVMVDGKEFSGSSPRVIANLDPGKHKVVVSKGENYLPFEQDVEVTAGTAVPLPVHLELKEVTLTLEVEPKGSTVSLVQGDKSTKIGEAGDSYKLVREPAVSYEIEAKAEGYITDRAPIDFSGEASQTVKLALVKDPKAKGAEPKPDVKPDKPKPDKPKPKPKPKAKTATLKIGTGPGLPPATVYVDGRKQSKTTPVIVKVTPGSHRIKWKWKSGKSTSKKVTVGDKKSIVVKGSP